MGLFDKIGEARVNQNSSYLGVGRYWIKVESTKIKQDKDGIDMFVMEATVVRSFDESGDHKPGYMGSHLTKKAGPSANYFLSDIKSVIVAGFGVSAEEVTPEICEMVVGEDQPLAGVVLEYIGNRVETKTSTPENPKYVTKRIYPRSVSFTELNGSLTDAEKERFFRGVDWEAAVAAEQADKS